MQDSLHLGIAKMNHNTRIRKADPQDSRLLSGIAFRSKAYWGYPPDFMEACREELSYSDDDINQHPFFVILADRRPVGFYQLRSKSEVKIELEALFVEPAFIGKGYGKKLLEHAKNTARESGAREMVILSDPNASAFYEKNGAQLIAERESGSIPGRYLPLFQIDLRE